MKEGNGEKLDQATVLPSSMFTDLEDPESWGRFKALMKFQYGFSDEELDKNIESLRQQERWKAEANFYLLEITDPEHEYFGRIGQLIWAMTGSFFGTIPTYKLDYKDLSERLKKEEGIENTLALVVKIDLYLVELRQDRGQYRLLNKLELTKETVEVVDDNGRVGVLLDWRGDETKNVRGFYRARFSEEVVEKEDWLMMQEPTWRFWRGGARR